MDEDGSDGGFRGATGGWGMRGIVSMDGSGWLRP